MPGGFSGASSCERTPRFPPPTATATTTATSHQPPALLPASQIWTVRASGVTDNEDLIKGDAAFRRAGGPSNRAGD